MRSKMLLALTVLLAVILFPIGCGNIQGCPLCGTTKNDGVTIIDVMAVPGAAGPGGTAFTVFDLGLVDPANHRYYVTDRSQNTVLVYDTLTDTPAGPASGGQIGQGVFTGAVCCAPNRAANFNPLTGPNGVVVTPGGSSKFGLVWASDGDSTVKVFDGATGAAITASQIGGGTLAKNGVTVSGIITGVPRDPAMIPQCITAGTGCGDFRADETSWDPKDNILLVSNGDPGPPPAVPPFVTLIDTTNPACGGNSCVKFQIFFDGGTGPFFPCPSGTGVAGALGQTVTCAHAPGGDGGIGGSAFNPTTGRFLVANTQVGPNPADSAITEIVAADPMTNHIFVPLQPAASCRAFANFGCIAVYAQQ